MLQRFAQVAHLALRSVPWIVLALFALFAANVAFAQKTGGSFGGGGFSSGGSSSGGGASGYSGGGDHDDPTDFLILAVEVVASDLPWPFKVVLLGVIAGAYFVYRGRKNRRRRQESAAADVETAAVAPPERSRRRRPRSARISPRCARRRR